MTSVAHRLLAVAANQSASDDDPSQGISAYESLAQSHGPFASYYCNEPSGTVIADSQGLHNGTLIGGGRVQPGLYSESAGAIYLDGVDDHIELGAFAGFFSQARWSIGFLGKVDAATKRNVLGYINDGTATLLQMQSNSDASGDEAAGRVNFRIRDDAGLDYRISVDAGIDDGAAHFLVFTFDSVAHEAEIYVDGYLGLDREQTLDESFAALSSPQVGVSLGAQTNRDGSIVASGSPMTIDGWVFYDFLLSPTEIAALNAARTA